MIKNGHCQLINQLESELSICSSEHGDCQDCEKKRVCIADFDYLVSEGNLNQENVQKFLERVSHV